MFKYFRKIIFTTIFFLAILNVAIFVKSINLANQISFFEIKTNKIHEENNDLKNEIYKTESLDYATSVAKSLDFTQPAKTIRIESLKYARKP